MQNDECNLNAMLDAIHCQEQLEIMKMALIFINNLHTDCMRKSFMEALHSGKLDDRQKMSCVCNLKILNKFDAIDKLLADLREKCEQQMVED